jgi:hypothetical protein
MASARGHSHSGPANEDDGVHSGSGSDLSEGSSLVRRRRRSIRQITQMLGPAAAPLWRAASLGAAALGGAAPSGGASAQPSTTPPQGIRSSSSFQRPF